MLDLLIPAGVLLVAVLAVLLLLARPDAPPQAIGWLDDRDGVATGGLPWYYRRGDFYPTDQASDEADVVELLLERRRASR